jgi:ubiquinone/menaquinone biosynthesis C-methylase UbiE
MDLLHISMARSAPQEHGDMIPPTMNNSSADQPLDDREIVQNYYRVRDTDGSYERDWGYINPVAAAYWRLRGELVSNALLQHSHLHQSIRVLEVGTGHGHELAKLAQLGISQSHMAGIDLVFHRLGTARHLYPGIHFSQQDATALAYANDSFDIVCQFTCLMHALHKDRQQMICNEMVRVLKPGGIIVWWDQAPVRKRVMVCRRFLHLSNRMFSLLNWRTTSGRDVSSQQSLPQKKISLKRGEILPIDRPDIIRMFTGLKVDAKYAGLDYLIWGKIWPHHRTLAECLWRRGWLSQHCFAVIQKPL